MSSHEQYPVIPLPCYILLPRLWRFPCGDMPYRCTSYNEYQQFLLGPQLGCPVYANSSSLFPPGQCVLIDDTCQFSPYAPAIPSKSLTGSVEGKSLYHDYPPPLLLFHPPPSPSHPFFLSLFLFFFFLPFPSPPPPPSTLFL